LKDPVIGQLSQKEKEKKGGKDAAHFSASSLKICAGSMIFSLSKFPLLTLYISELSD